MESYRSTPKSTTQEARTTRSERLKAALEYAERGWAVFPCKGGSKEPVYDKSRGLEHGYLEATVDPRKIHAWWNAYPQANIGIATGERSGVLALDVDQLPALEDLEAKRGELPPTRTHATGSGGVHYLFSYPKTGERFGNSSGDLPQGLDVRGEGGYIIAPPSATTRPYEVLESLPLAEPPEWLLEALRKPERGSRGEASPSIIGPGVSVDLDGPPIPKHSRNVTLASIAGRLHDGTRDLAGLTADLLAINSARCTPPLPESEVGKIARSIYGTPTCKPGSPQVSPEVLEELAKIEAWLDARGWSGTQEHTVYDLMVAAIGIAKHHGYMIPSGIRFEASVRELAEEASIGSTKTVWRALNLARHMGLIRRDGTGSGPKRGALVLLSRAEGNTLTTTEFLREREYSSVSFGAPHQREASPKSAPRLRWSAPGHAGRLNKRRGRIVDVLEVSGSLDADALADALAGKDGKRPRTRDLRRRDLPPLIESRVVECAEGEFRLSADWRDALERRREEDGEIEAARLQRLRHEEQRAAFQEAWQRGEIVSKEEFARRRRRRDRIRADERHVSGKIRELERVSYSEADKRMALELSRYLYLNPHRGGETPSWLAVALWSEEWVDTKLTTEDVERALNLLETRGLLKRVA